MIQGEVIQIRFLAPRTSWKSAFEEGILIDGFYGHGPNCPCWTPFILNG